MKDGAGYVQVSGPVDTVHLARLDGDMTTVAAIGGTFLALVLISGGPFIGWRIEHQRAAVSIVAVAEYHTGEIPLRIDPEVARVEAFMNDPLGTWFVPESIQLEDAVIADALESELSTWDIDAEWREWDLVPV